jgi:hypothetical protein
MDSKRKNAILLAVACVLLLAAGLSLYLQLGSNVPDTPAPSEPAEAAVAESGDDIAMDDEEEDLDWEEQRPVRRTGGYAFPPGYDGPLEGTETNPPEPQ